MTHTARFKLHLDESLEWLKNNPNCAHSEIPENLAVLWLSEPALGFSVFLAGWLKGKMLVSELMFQKHKKEFPYAFDYLPAEVEEKYTWWKIRVARSLLERTALTPSTAVAPWDFHTSCPDTYSIKMGTIVSDDFPIEKGITWKELESPHQ